MFARVFAVLCLLMPSAVFADDVSMTWTAVTTRVDGSAITGAVDYVVSKNGQELATVTETAYTANGTVSDQFCVYARENGYPGAPACVTIGPYPNTPQINIQIIFEL